MKQVFGTYGPVLKVVFHGSSHPVKGRAAFVLYGTQDAAEDAIEVLNQVYKIRENAASPLVVRWAKPAGARRSSAWEDGAWDAGGAWEAGGWQGDSWGGSAWSEGRPRPRGRSDGWTGGWTGGGWSASSTGGQEGWPEKSRESVGWTESSAGWAGASAGSGKSSWSGAGGKGSWRKGTGKRGVPEAKRPCATPGCKFAATWHATHCCYLCLYKGVHGPQCDRQLLQCGAAPEQASGQSQSGGEGVGADRAAGAGAAAERVPEARDGMPGGVHVFANLPSDIDEEALKQVFETYGQVTGVRLEGDKANEGRAHAFIDYTTAWDAETSVLSLDNEYEIRKGFGPLRLKLAQAGARSAPY
mmetsp:Transcript_19527/g.61921  ORF Transcript_19527/g.61921 Transcript_19527/m.61921 type:complete len:357 (-) Transcript_19527:25-1095(-)